MSGKAKLIPALFAVFALFLPPLLFSCAQPGQEDAQDYTQAREQTLEEAAAEEREPEIDFSSMSFIERLTYDRSQIADGLPMAGSEEADWQGADYRIGYLYFSPTHFYTLDWVAEELTGEVYNDAVYNRQLTVENRFNVHIIPTEHPDSDYVTAFTASILADDSEFEMASIHPGHISHFTTKGYLLPLNEMPYLDLAKPWWMADGIESYSYLGYVFSAYGTGTGCTVVGNSSVTFFNKQMAEDYGLENLYDVVREGRWTWDYVKAAINGVTADLNGDGAIGDPDSHGLNFSHDNALYRFVWTFGGRYVVHDADGLPVLNMDDPLLETVFERTREMTENPDVYASPGYAEDYIDGDTLFEAATVLSVNAYRNADFDTGILPMFKLDEAQEHYLTVGGGCPQVIPITCHDKRFASMIMEAVNAEGYRQIIPAYYQTSVKYKMTDDEDSAEMLDLTLTHVVYDGNRLFMEDSTFLLSTFCSSGKGYGSMAQGAKKMYQKTLDRNLKQLQDVIDRLSEGG